MSSDVVGVWPGKGQIVRSRGYVMVQRKRAAPRNAMQKVTINSNTFPRTDLFQTPTHRRKLGQRGDEQTKARERTIN